MYTWIIIFLGDYVQWSYRNFGGIQKQASDQMFQKDSDSSILMLNQGYRNETEKWHGKTFEKSISILSPRKRGRSFEQILYGLFLTTETTSKPYLVMGSFQKIVVSNWLTGYKETDVRKVYGIERLFAFV